MGTGYISSGKLFCQDSLITRRPAWKIKSRQYGTLLVMLASSTSTTNVSPAHVFSFNTMTPPGTSDAEHRFKKATKSASVKYIAVHWIHIRASMNTLEQQRLVLTSRIIVEVLTIGLGWLPHLQL